VFFHAATCTILAAVFALPHLAGATVVRMEIGPGTPPGSAPLPILGIIDIELYDDEAPKTVANFLRYAALGLYNNVFVHVGLPNFVIQSGGYTFDIFGPKHIDTYLPVPNEFSPSRSNARGTIAMAKLNNAPDSATSEWFINLADNGGAPYELDSANGGYTVFGHVLDSGPGNGMVLVDMVANLPHPDFNDPNMQGLPFPELPLLNYDPAINPDPSNLVTIIRIPNVTSIPLPLGNLAILTTDVDMAFDSDRTGIITNNKALLLAAFTPPLNTTVEFRDEIYAFTIAGTTGSARRSVTLLNGTVTRPTHYYAADTSVQNAPPRWYDFTFDGETGAEIVGNKIVLHFVDGKRGDDDGIVNGSITHIGTPVLVTDIVSTTSSGCTIATTASQTSRGGDWILVSLFLTMLALARKRAGQSKSPGD
jgi:cyclophilin family peptidyl-prolyl cis-trans isomerase